MSSKLTLFKHIYIIYVYTHSFFGVDFQSDALFQLNFRSMQLFRCVQNQPEKCNYNQIRFDLQGHL